MIPVDQIVFEDGRGDCLRACIASILDLPVADLPNFAESDYVNGAKDWLNDRGVHCLQIDWTGDKGVHDIYMSTGNRRVYAVVMGLSPRWIPGSEGRRKGHAVVGHACGWHFEIDHDPHPSRSGLMGEPDSVLWIFAQAAAKTPYTVAQPGDKQCNTFFADKAGAVRCARDVHPDANHKFPGHDFEAERAK